MNMENNGCSKKYRITKNYEYQNVFQNGTSVATRYLVLYFTKNQCEKTRAGFIVSKKVGNAVIRNRVKRMLKESYRVNTACVKNGYDLVFIARPKAKMIGFNQAAAEMKRILQKCGLVTVCVSDREPFKDENNR